MKKYSVTEALGMIANIRERIEEVNDRLADAQKRRDAVAFDAFEGDANAQRVVDECRTIEASTPGDLRQLQSALAQAQRHLEAAKERADLAEWMRRAKLQPARIARLKQIGAEMRMHANALIALIPQRAEVLFETGSDGDIKRRKKFADHQKAVISNDYPLIQLAVDIFGPNPLGGYYPNVLKQSDRSPADWDLERIAHFLLDELDVEDDEDQGEAA